MTTPQEYWRDIPWTGGAYQCSRNAEIRRVLTGGRTRPVKVTMSHKPGRQPQCRVTICLNGKARGHTLMTVMTRTWLKRLPPGMTYHHANGNTMDYRLENLQPISSRELGRRVGKRARAKCVEKVAADGGVVELFFSIGEAARCEYISREAISDRCHGKIKRPYELTGYTYRFEEGRRHE